MSELLMAKAAASAMLSLIVVADVPKGHPGYNTDIFGRLCGWISLSISIFILSI